MFNDERINLQIGRIYKRGIIAAVVLAVFWMVTRSVYWLVLTDYVTPQELFVTFIPDGIVLFTGLIILLIDVLLFAGKTDERKVFLKSKYYRGATWFFLGSIFLGFILNVPYYFIASLFTRNESAINSLLYCLLVLGAIYLVYSFRKHQICFNYAFVEDEDKGYYSKVLMNILKAFAVAVGAMGLGILIIFLSIPRADDALGEVLMRTVVSSYDYVVFLLIGSVLYFLLSVSERKNILFSADDRLFGKGDKMVLLSYLIISLIVNCLTITSNVLFAYFYEYTFKFVYALDIISTVSTVLNGTLSILSCVALCSIIRVLKNKGVSSVLAKIIIIEKVLSILIGIALNGIYALRIDVKVISKISVIRSNVDFYVHIVLAFVFLVFLVKELGLSKKMYAIPFLHLLYDFVPRITNRIAEFFADENASYTEKHIMVHLKSNVYTGIRTVLIVIIFVIMIRVLTSLPKNDEKLEIE